MLEAGVDLKQWQIAIGRVSHRGWCAELREVLPGQIASAANMMGASVHDEEIAARCRKQVMGI